MAWNQGYHCRESRSDKDLNDLLGDVKGPLESPEARIWFARFCKANPSFAVRLLMGVKLAPIQDVIIRALFKKDFSLIIAGRGFSKSFLVSVFIILYAIFYPGSKIGICSGTYRQSKNIFKQIEKFINSADGVFLKQCVTKKINKSGDAWEVGIGGSSIIATPMGGGDRLRGYRFNVMVMDELLLIKGEIINNVIRPFLSVKMNGQEESEIRKHEDILIKEGVLKEEDRTVFQNNKLIGLSSADFKFGSLYKDNYEPYVKAILDNKAEDVNHCVFRLSYRLAPDWLLDQKLINESRRTMSAQQFSREFDAIFTDDSGGYFSVSKMEEATRKPGEMPCIKIKGDTSKKYILSMDPNHNDAETSDNFAMAVLELDEENKTGTLVHAYALPKSGTKKRALYFKYLLEHFNIVYIIVDNSGGPQFIRDCADLDLLPKKIEEFDSDFMNTDYQQGINNAKYSYNLTSGKILHSQVFNQTGWIRKANEILQGSIEHKRITFGSKISPTDLYEGVVDEKIPIDTLEFSINDDIGEGRGKTASLIDNVETLIDLTKKECGLVEITTSSTGVQNFDLPSGLRDRSSPNRARKDSYTALLLACFGMYCYFDMTKNFNTFSEELFFTPTWLS